MKFIRTLYCCANQLTAELAPRFRIAFQAADSQSSILDRDCQAVAIVAEPRRRIIHAEIQRPAHFRRHFAPQPNCQRLSETRTTRRALSPSPFPPPPSPFENRPQQHPQRPTVVILDRDAARLARPRHALRHGNLISPPRRHSIRLPRLEPNARRLPPPIGRDPD